MPAARGLAASGSRSLCILAALRAVTPVPYLTDTRTQTASRNPGPVPCQQLLISQPFASLATDQHGDFTGHQQALCGLAKGRFSKAQMASHPPGLPTHRPSPQREDACASPSISTKRGCIMALRATHLLAFPNESLMLLDGLAYPKACLPFPTELAKQKVSPLPLSSYLGDKTTTGLLLFCVCSFWLFALNHLPLQSTAWHVLK